MMWVVLSQIRVFSVTRLYEKMGEINGVDMNKIVAGFANLYLC